MEKPPKKTGFSPEMLKFDMKKSSLVALAASALMVLMTFLPYVTVEMWGVSQSASLMDDGDGIYFIIIALCGIIAGLAGEKKWILGVGIAACVLVSLKVAEFSNEVNKMGSMKDAIGVGIGFWLMILSSAGMVAAPFVEKYVPKDKFTK